MNITKLPRLRGGTKDSGQTLVEFAMALPLLALLLFGIIQYGFIFGAYITLRNASAVAARHAILQSPTPTQTSIENVARGAIQPMLSPANLASVSITSVDVAGQ